MKNIVILGGGYGGYKITTQLLPKLPTDTKITLIDRTPYHSMKTEFYALAAGTISDRDIRLNFPEDEKLSFICDEIISVNPEEQKIILREKENISYDTLIIGLGCEDDYHGIEGAEEHSHSVQTIKKARKSFEKIQNIKPYGSVTVVGGGLSGIELASELRESRSDLNIRLLDRGETILRPFPEKVQTYVTDWFIEHDVQVIHNSLVNYVEPDVVCNDGECLLTDVTVWTAGTKPSKVIRKMPIERDHYGRALINEFHRIPKYPNIYVVGDCASLPYAPSAQVAKQQGKQIVDILSKELIGKTPSIPGEIKIKGTLGSLGKSDGFGTPFNLSVVGTVPRIAKTGVLWIHKFS